MKLMLADLFSTKEAAEYLGIKSPTLRHYVYQTKEFQPITVGNSAVYTRRMLEAWKAGERPVTPTQAEEEKLFSTEQAANYVYSDGYETDPLHAFKYHVENDNLPYKVVGNTRVFLQLDLDYFKANKREPGRPPGTD